MTWQAPLVTLACGRQVRSDSAEWRDECGARHLLAMDIPTRRAVLAKIGERQGGEAVAELRKRCYELEPAYVLDLPGIEARRAYLTRLEQEFGTEPRQRLEQKIRALHAERRARTAPAEATSA